MYINSTAWLELARICVLYKFCNNKTSETLDQTMTITSTAMCPVQQQTVTNQVWVADENFLLDSNEHHPALGL